jgi:hypothetical protein
MIQKNIKCFKILLLVHLKLSIKEMNTDVDKKHLEQELMRIKDKHIRLKSIIKVLIGFGKKQFKNQKSVILIF